MYKVINEKKSFDKDLPVSRPCNAIALVLLSRD